MSQRWVCPEGHNGNDRLPLPTCPVCGLPVDYVKADAVPAEANANTLVGNSKTPVGDPVRQADLVFLEQSKEPAETIAPGVSRPTDRERDQKPAPEEATLSRQFPPALPASRKSVTPLSTQDETQMGPRTGATRPTSPLSGPPTEEVTPHGATLVKQSSSAGEQGTSRTLPGQSGSDYEILGILGRGGMGVVYKARQVGLNRTVALKMILHGSHATTEDLIRFKIEAEAIAAMQHPNIVQVFDIGEREGRPFFSLEYLEGGSLAHRLRGTPLTPRVAAILLEKIARGMEYAHRHGVIHRDLKPANILIVEPSSTPIEGCTPKITDFGLAKRLDEVDQGQTGTEAVLGTPTYMAPEQAANSKSVGPAADIYALGAILYDCLTGRPPFKGTTVLDTLQMVQKTEPVAPRTLNKSIPRDLQTICLKCLEKDPAKRYVTADALANDLRCYLEGEPITARPVGFVERAVKWAKRNPAQAGLVTVMFLAPLVVALVSTFAYIQLEKSHSELSQANSTIAVQNKELAKEKQDLAESLVREKAANEAVMRESAEKEKERARAVQETKNAEQLFVSAQAAVSELIKLAQTRLRNEPRSEEVRRGLLADGIKACQPFIDRPGSTPQSRLRAARAHRLLGDLYARLGNRANADSNFQSALKIYKDLIAEGEKSKVTGADYNSELMETEMQRLNLWQGRDPNKAEVMFNEILSRLDSTSVSIGSEAIQKRNRAVVLANRGILNQSQRRWSAAKADYEAATATLNEVSSDLKEVELARVDVNLSAYYLERAMQKGEGRERDDELGNAAFVGKRAARNLRKLLTANGRDIDVANDLGRAYNHLGLVHVARKDMPAASEVYNEAVDVFEKLHKDFPLYVDYKHLLGTSLGNQGLQYLREGEPAKAKEVLGRGRKLLEELVRDFDDFPMYRQDLARLYTSQGVMSLSPRDPAKGKDRLTIAAEAQGPLTDARRALKEAFAKAPESSTAEKEAIQRDLSAVERNLTVCHDRQARLAAERKDWKRVEDHVKELAKMREERVKALPLLKEGASPVDKLARAGEAVLARAELVGTLRALAAVREMRQDYRGVVEAVEKTRPYLPANNLSWIDSAAMLCRCIPMVEKDTTLQKADRAKLVERYGKQALELLVGLPRSRELIEALDDDDFRPLRERSAFKDEFRKLQARAKRE